MTKNEKQSTQDFDALSEQVNRMLELLKHEAALIKSKDIEGIETIAGEKQSLAANLNFWVTQQQRKLVPPTTPDRLDASKHSNEPNFNFPLDRTLRDRWNQIKSLLMQCKLLNETNGACVELLKRHCQRSLEVLYKSDNATHTYGPNGATQASLPSRSLTLA